MNLRADIQPIGVDIGHDSVKLLQLAVNGVNLSVRAAAMRELPPATTGKPEDRLEAGMAAAADMIKRGGFIGHRVVVALPREIVHIKNLRLPLIPAAELASAIRFEARNVFPFDTEFAHVEFLAAGDVRQGAEARQEVIVLAAKQADVVGYLERLDRAGLIPASFDVEPCALYRSIERFIRRRDDEQEVHVLLDMGLRRTQVLIGRGRELGFFKPVDIGGQRLTDAVAKRLGISPDEARSLRRRLADTPAIPTPSDSTEQAPQDPVRQAVFHATRGILEELGREVSLCLRYYSVTFRGPGPTRVRLMGGEGHDPDVATVLSAVLSIPVVAAQPLRNVDFAMMKAADRQGPLCHWTTALGLALKKTTGKFAALDGKPRTMRQGFGEVIDLNQAVGAGAASESKPAVVDVAGGATNA
jgi:type IV pilus assembly protein PilM